jgi:hypothetical protein
MNALDLKKIISVSFAGHIALLALFSTFRFSFGDVRPRAAFAPVISCGSMFPQTAPAPEPVRPFLRTPVRAPAAAPSSGPVLFDYYIKPASVLPYVPDREPVVSSPIFPEIPERKDPVLLMHPLLPYQFELYFKDRQTVHIELEFEITRAEDRNFVSLRRKISSGNLEADLLSMRYIEHYLFIQQARFMPATWQTVKIEFSPHTR